MRSPELEAMLALGITQVKAQFALAEFDNQVEVAADWCFTEGHNWTPQALLSLHHDAPRPPSPPVITSSRPSRSSGPPPHQSLKPRHTQVAIVLKPDQGSGREVEGTVLEILTRGDHPRGVKVRLTDGRVGRVQRLI